jgi:type I restriction enzyme S subunit
MSVRAPVGDVNIANIEYCIGRGLASISLFEGNNTFLFYLLKHFKKDIEKEGTGSTFKAINKSKLEEFKIPLPPLPEQKKIAAVLSAVQSAKEKTEDVLKAAKELKKSLMKHLFTYGPVPAAEAGNVPLKETEIGLMPEEWEVVRLGEIADKFLGGGTPSTQKKEYWGGDIEWTTSKRLDNNNGIYLWNGEKKITKIGLENSSTHLIPKDNLIIGTRVGVGKVAINKVDIAISQDLTGAFIDKNKYNLEFLAYRISNNDVQQIFLGCTRGTTIKGIPRDDLEKIQIGCPPLPVQQKIASILSEIDEKIEAEESVKKALEDLFKTLLHDLMTAKIRVNDLNLNLGGESG